MLRGIANQRWPARVQGHNCIVDPDRKEDGGALLAFPCQGGFDLLLHPLARHGRLRQDEEQLIIEADSLINPGTDAVADFQILGRKPAAHALVLEIRIEAFSEGMVLARIADEAGMKLDQGVQYGDGGSGRGCRLLGLM